MTVRTSAFVTVAANCCVSEGFIADGVFTLTIPTSGGTEHIKNTETFAYGAFKAGSAFSGTFQGDRMSGTFEAQPIEGDCASKPVTKFHVKGKGTLN